MNSNLITIAFDKDGQPTQQYKFTLTKGLDVTDLMQDQELYWWRYS